MNDKALLKFLYDRLHEYYGEKPNYDYMHKLKAIIDATPEDRITAINSSAIKQPSAAEALVFKRNSPAVEMLRRRAAVRTYTTTELVGMLNGKRPVPAGEPLIKEYVDLLRRAE